MRARCWLIVADYETTVRTRLNDRVNELRGRNLHAEPGTIRFNALVGIAGGARRVHTRCEVQHGYDVGGQCDGPVGDKPLHRNRQRRDIGLQRRAEAMSQSEQRSKDSSRHGHDRFRSGNSVSPKQDEAEQFHAKMLGLRGRTTRQDVRKRYRELASQYHPDKVSHLGEELQDVAKRKMKQINEAYDYFRRKYGL